MDLAPLYSALVAAQSEMINVQRDSAATSGPAKYRYVSLDAVIDATTPVLSRHGLAIVQASAPAPDGYVGVRTLIVHTSGAHLDCGALVLPAGRQTTKSERQGNPDLPQWVIAPDPQKYGSAHTYARRYAWLAACGIAPTDDDAQTAMGNREAVAERTDPEAAARRAEERAAANVQAVMTAVDKMREMSAQWSDDARTATDEICDRLMNGDIDIPDARTEFGALVRRNRS